MSVSAHVAGCSLGAWVALELALLGRARSVTGLCPAGLWPRPLAPRRATARRMARALLPVAPLLARSASARRLMLGATIHRPRRVSPAAAVRMLRAYVSAPGFDSVNAAMRSTRFTELARVPVPVTLAWGEFDRLVTPPSSVPAGIDSLLLSGCGHLPMWDDPGLVAGLLASRAVEPEWPVPTH